MLTAEVEVGPVMKQAVAVPGRVVETWL